MFNTLKRKKTFLEIQVIKQAVREVLHEELPKILTEIMLNLIPEDEPEEDEKEFVGEGIKAEDYTPLEDILEKYE